MSAGSGQTWSEQYKFSMKLIKIIANDYFKKNSHHNKSC